MGSDPFRLCDITRLVAGEAKRGPLGDVIKTESGSQPPDAELSVVGYEGEIQQRDGFNKEISEDSNERVGGCAALQVVRESLQPIH